MNGYPRGAIKSVQELESYAGMPIWHVSNRFQSISELQFRFSGSIAMCEPKSTDELEKACLSNEYPFNRSTYYDEYKWGVFYNMKYKYTCVNSLLDANVIQLNHYNDWFMFSSETDAYYFLLGE